LSDVPHQVLIVEDNEADVFLIEEAIKSAKVPVSLYVARNGEQATSYFDRVDRDSETPGPALVILDINLPRKPGYEVLKHLRKSRRSATAHVIVVSTSDSPRDRDQMKQLGADRYFRKPSEYAGFMKLGELVKALLSSDDRS